ncbi:exported hypothetical protein [Magnetospirillum sp. LM-5]|uniref:hypothetical protein n=1 Tax=Magnetospirillum sp. LM-5 TaxID=2681466 RepID=UPI0013814EEC|nr:hypothetical protein [Magnetospirillum sp. LM-5]CAA7614927.1 exported hypothetical protein [Magnetospirillum sp. LM-5]
MLKRIVLLFAILALTMGGAEAKSLGGPTCPAAWTFDGQRLKLRWAKIYVGWEALAPIEGRTREGKDWQEPEGRRDVDEVFWGMGSFKKPAFLYCMYGNGLALNPETAVVVPVSDDSKTCHAEYRDTPKAAYITSISCSPGKAPVPPLSVVERLTPQTELDGLMLRKSRAELEARTAARGAVWTDEVGKDRKMVAFPDNGAHYRVECSSTTGLAHEIALIGPVAAPDFGFGVSIQRRFGPYNLNPWKGEDNIWVVWDDGYRKDKPRVPEEMRLLDMNAPENQGVLDRKN